MFELNLRAEGPSLTEVVTHIDYGMGDVELTVAGIVFVVLG